MKRRLVFFCGGWDALSLLLIACFYMVLVGGGGVVSLKEGGVAFLSVFLCVFTVGVLILVKGGSGSLLASSLLLLPYTIILLFGSLLGGGGQGLEKIDSVFFSAAIGGGVFSLLLFRLGVGGALRLLILWAVIVLFLTFLYKMHFGFFDRQVRFFLNGPIVFGWIVGGVGLLSFYFWVQGGGRGYLFLSMVFFFALLWTASKGPLLIVCAFGLFFYVKRKGVGGVIPVVLLVVGGYFFTPYIMELPGLERLGAINRLLGGELSDSDYGSVSVRKEMYRESLDMLYESPLFGVGLGGWQEHSRSEFLYPHNVPLELVSEIGLVLTAVFFMVYLVYALAGGGVSVAISLFFLGCMLFSGDVGYLRFPIALQVAFVLNRMAANRREVKTCDSM